jgi:predicted dehydrogenase
MSEEGTRTGPRVAVVGCGQIADAHLQQARRAGGRVVAVCDTSIHLAEQAAARFEVPGWFDDLGAMFDQARVDVVHVTTPPATHLKLARAALERGAHVYVEKPFTVNAREADELAEVARRAGRLVCVGHNLVFDPGALRLAELVARGDLGEIVHVDALMGYDLAGPFGSLVLSDAEHWVHRLPGGLAQNNLSHPLSLALSLLGPGEVEVQARGWRLRPARFGDARDRFHDEVRVMIEGERSTASVQFSCRVRPVQLTLSVFGTRGNATLSLDARTLRTVQGSKMPGPFQKVDWARHDAVEAARELLGRASDLLSARLHYFEGMAELLRRFYAATAGREAPPIPIGEAQRVTAVMDSVFRACAAREHGATAAEVRA